MPEQRLIDANKIEYENIYVYPTDSRNYRECVGRSAKIREAETVLTIPENPTNEEMLKALFPDINLLKDVNGSMFFVRSKEWWNAPYKRGTQ